MQNMQKQGGFLYLDSDPSENSPLLPNGQKVASLYLASEVSESEQSFVPTLQSYNSNDNFFFGQRKPDKQNQALLTFRQIACTVTSSSSWWGSCANMIANCKHVERKVILDSISGVARPGQILAIIGPNGSGKR